MGSFDNETKIWSGVKVPYPLPLDSYLGHEILKNLDATPDRIIQINHDEQVIYTCKEVKILSIRIAQSLIKMNIKSDDDVVGMICRNSSHLMPLLYGSIIAGAPVNPVFFAKDEIASIFSKTNPKIVFCDYDLYDIAKEALNEIKSDALIYTTIKKLSGVNFIGELLEPTGNEDEFVPGKFAVDVTKKIGGFMCSSGTTGPSKACIISHMYVLPYTDWGLPFPHKSFSFSPSYWGTGIIGLVLAAFHTNETVVSTMKSFSVDLLVKIIEQYKINVVFMAPAQLFLFLNSSFAQSGDFSSVKAVTSTGSICMEHIREMFKKVLPGRFLNIFYGLTEVLVASMSPGQSFEGLQVGKVFPNNQLKVIDDEGEPLEIGGVGEICIKSKSAFLGYYKNPEATKASMTTDGFFKTGDIGNIDEQGNVYLLDRQKRIFKCFSYHVSFRGLTFCN